MKITEKLLDIITGEETIIEREETAQEIAERETFEAEKAERLAAQAETVAARQALLARLGITAEEAQLLLGGN
jgi:hypothetical protein